MNIGVRELTCSWCGGRVSQSAAAPIDVEYNS
jgi:hypothetical protein